MARGFGHDPKLAGGFGPRRYFCSMQCMEGRDNVIDKTFHETKAVEEACAAAGEFLDEMLEGGYQADMTQWPAEAFESFIECIVTAYAEKLRAMAASAEPPF
jgi:Family of unknown function (DUF6511)